MARDLHKHLTEDEVIGFVLEDLPAEAMERVDQHLEQCVYCAQQLEDFHTAQEEFPAARWATQRDAFVASLRQQIFGTPQPEVRQHLAALLQQATASLQVLFGRPLAWRASTDGEERRRVWEWQSQDGTLSGHAVLARNGDLTVRFVSKELAAGTRFFLRLGAIRQEVVLQRVSPTEVGAKVVIPRAQRPAEVTAIALEMD